MDTMIAPVVRRVVGIARLFQDVFVGKENGFVANRPDGPTLACPPGFPGVSDRYCAANDRLRRQCRAARIPRPTYQEGARCYAVSARDILLGYAVRRSWPEALIADRS